MPANCAGGAETFGGGVANAAGGIFYYCIGGVNSFTVNGSPTVRYGIRAGAVYP